MLKLGSFRKQNDPRGAFNDWNTSSNLIAGVVHQHLTWKSWSQPPPRLNYLTITTRTKKMKWILGIQESKPQNWIFVWNQLWRLWWSQICFHQKTLLARINEYTSYFGHLVRPRTQKSYYLQSKMINLIAVF